MRDDSKRVTPVPGIINLHPLGLSRAGYPNRTPAGRRFLCPAVIRPQVFPPICDTIDAHPMPRKMANNVDHVLSQLQQLSELVQVSIAAYSAQARGDGNNAVLEGSLPSRALFDAQRTLLAASGLLTELVSDPSSRLLEVSSQYFESRALHIVADQRLADVLARNQQQPDIGVGIETLAKATGIEVRKLGRVMRCLCSIHIFREVGPDRFANNRVSAALVGNEPLRAYILMLYVRSFSLRRRLPHHTQEMGMRV